MTPRGHALGVLGVAWGVGGLAYSLAEAIVRLTPLALEPLHAGMDALHWTLYLGFVALNAYAEGYRGFQLRFSPRVAARARVLMESPTAARVVFAPLFLMGLVDATPRRLRASWGLAIGIVALVLAVRRLAQPYRGIVDAGVVVGLAWGLASVLWELLRAWRGAAPCVDPELSAEAGVPQKT